MRSTNIKEPLVEYKTITDINFSHTESVHLPVFTETAPEVK